MKINLNNVSFILANDKGVRNNFIETQLKNNRKLLTERGQIDDFDMDEVDDYITRTFDMMLTPKCKRFIITKSAMEVIERIKIDKVDMNIFHKVPLNETWEFLISPDKCYRTCYDGAMLRGMEITAEKTEFGMGRYVGYNSFGYEINHETGEAARETENVDALKDIVDEWVRILVFIQFSDPDTVLLQAGRKYGTTRHNRIKNESKSNYIVVNSRWNSTVVRSEGFKVSGHFRLQACGKGMKDRKLIYVDEFEKNGYTRRSGKETSSVN